jgi:hypothetical protein
MAYPAFAPTSRSFAAGDYQYKTYKAQNGKEVRILYGDKRTGMTLDLATTTSRYRCRRFHHSLRRNQGRLHLVHACPLRFAPAGAVNAAAIDAATGNQWRYDGPPQITSVRPGISSVTVKLVGVL